MTSGQIEHHVAENTMIVGCLISRCSAGQLLVSKASTSRGAALAAFDAMSVNALSSTLAQWRTLRGDGFNANSFGGAPEREKCVIADEQKRVIVVIRTAAQFLE